MGVGMAIRVGFLDVYSLDPNAPVFKPILSPNSCLAKFEAARRCEQVAATCSQRAGGGG